MSLGAELFEQPQRSRRSESEWHHREAGPSAIAGRGGAFFDTMNVIMQMHANANDVHMLPSACIFPSIGPCQCCCLAMVRVGIRDESPPSPCMEPNNLPIYIYIYGTHLSACVWSHLPAPSCSCVAGTFATHAKPRQEISDMARAGETGSSRSSRRDAWSDTKNQTSNQSNLLH